MVHKLRLSMGKRDNLYQLNGGIELDEGFFSTEIEASEKDKALKRGRGSQRKTKVLVMVESEKVEGDDKKGKGKKSGYLKMKVIPDLKSQTITPIVEDMVSKDSTIVSDDSTSYVGLKDHVHEHKPEAVDPKNVVKLLPWVHLAISNAKRLILDMYHDVKPEYLQMYLDEFCYKYNRRYFGEKLFDRLVIACVTSKNEFRY
jgi:transposase-like protein